jgi:hypothetical protein
MAIIVVAEKRTLCNDCSASAIALSNCILAEVFFHYQMLRSTYHSKAPNTTAPLAAPQTVPLQKSRPERKTAAARKPANQKIMVTASAARMPNLCAAVGRKRGERAR